MTTEPRLLPIITCGDCPAIIRIWEGASLVFVCRNLGRTICSWMTPRPPIPPWCPLPKAHPEDTRKDAAADREDRLRHECNVQRTRAEEAEALAVREGEQ